MNTKGIFRLHNRGRIAHRLADNGHTYCGVFVDETNVFPLPDDWVFCPQCAIKLPVPSVSFEIPLWIFNAAIRDGVSVLSDEKSAKHFASKGFDTHYAKKGSDLLYSVSI